MDNKDNAIAHLLNSLDLIRREAEREDARRHYIIGVAEQAAKNIADLSERNADGYMVVVR